MRKIVSILLAVAMLLTAIPLGAMPVFAATSGTTGDCTWTLDNRGHLTISGNGVMADYADFDWDDGSFHPWSIYLVRSLTITDGVTNIGDNAFRECEELTSVEISSTITVIGEDAFSGCRSLTSVVIPDGVITIGDRAFDWCFSLTTVTIPDSVITIGNYAFRSCGLTSLEIPSSVTTIGYGGFASCEMATVTIPGSVTAIGAGVFANCLELTSIAVVPANENYCSVDGVLFDKTKTILHAYPSGKSRVYSIPNGVITIGEQAFSDCALTSVTIPDSVTTINNFAFLQCEALTSITIPDSVTTIGEGAFAYCTELTSVTIPNSVTTIAYAAFAGCFSLETVTIPNKITSISPLSFAYNYSLTSISIPINVTAIGSDAFSDCSDLTDVYYGGAEEDRAKIDIDPYANERLLNATWHYNCSIVTPSIEYGLTRFTFGEEFTGYIGDELNTLVLYTSDTETTEALTITSSNPSVVEIGAVQHGYGEYITLENEHIATIPLKLKAEGAAVITITSPEGVSVSVPVTVSPVLYEVKLYSEIPTLVVGVGKAIGGALQLERNGVVVEEPCQYAFAVSDNTTLSVSDVKAKADGVYFAINGHKEGAAVITITEVNTGSIVTAPIYVNNGLITYNAEALPSYYDKHVECNGIIGGMYMDSFVSEQEDEEWMCVSFDIYNSTSLAGVVDVYDENHVLQYSYPIKRFENAVINSFYETLQSGYYLVEDWLVTDNILTYRQSSFSEKTEFRNIRVPVGGHIEITNNVYYSDACCVLNAAQLTLNALFTFGGTLTEVAELSPKQVEEVSSKLLFQREILNSLPELATKIQDEIVDKLTEEGLSMPLRDALAMISESTIDIMASCDIDFTDVVIASAGEVGVGIVEDAFVVATAGIGATLKVMFIAAEYAELSCYTTQFARPRTETAMRIYFNDERGCLTHNGVSIKAENGSTVLSESNFVMHSLVLTPEEGLTNVMQDSLNEISNNYVVRDIYLERDGVVSQPGQWVQVSIPVPADYDIDNCCIYLVKDDGSLVQMTTNIEGNCLVFTTDHFSYYALVEMSEQLAGDANSDGKVNVKDLGLLQQHLNGWDIDISEEAMDVNADGKVNVKDLGLLQQYLNGWDVELK